MPPVGPIRAASLTFSLAAVTLPGLLGRQPGALRLPQTHGPGRRQETAHPGTRPGHRSRGAAHLQPGRGRTRHPGHHPHPQRRGHRQSHRKAGVQERRPHHPAQRDLYRHSDLGYLREAQGRAGAGGASLPRHCIQKPVPQGQQATARPRPQAGPSPAGGQFLPAQRLGQVPRLPPGHVRPGLQERPVRLLRLPVVDEAGQRGLRVSQAQRPTVRGDGGGPHPRQHPHRVQHPGVGQAGGRGDGRHRPGAAPAAGDCRGGTGRREAAAGAALQPGRNHRSGRGRLHAPHP